MFELPLICAALAIAAWSAWRAHVPPQTRKLIELQGRVEDLEFAYEQTSARLTKRARTEGMDEARQANTERRRRQDRIEQEAHAILEAAQTAGAQDPAALKTQQDPAAVKAQLRAVHLTPGRKPQ